jgi:hypothetical protein
MEFPMPSNTHRFYNLSQGDITDDVRTFRQNNDLDDERFQKFYDLMQSKRDQAANKFKHHQISFVVETDEQSDSGYKIRAVPDKDAKKSFERRYPNYDLT